MNSAIMITSHTETLSSDWRGADSILVIGKLLGNVQPRGIADQFQQNFTHTHAHTCTHTHTISLCFGGYCSLSIYHIVIFLPVFSEDSELLVDRDW